MKWENSCYHPTVYENVPFRLPNSKIKSWKYLTDPASCSRGGSHQKGFSQSVREHRKEAKTQTFLGYTRILWRLLWLKDSPKVLPSGLFGFLVLVLVFWNCKDVLQDTHSINILYNERILKNKLNSKKKNFILIKTTR